jgi:catechol 2,3-dioxygenase-like lactoylglutathione lyase family enzyme
VSASERGAPPRSILETCLYTSDLDAAERFYTEVLGLEVIGRVAGRHVFFRTGDGVFLVFNPDVTESVVTTVGGVGVPLHGARGPGHAAFRVRNDEIPGWRERLRARGVSIEADVVWPQGARSIYFRDPAGNSVELASPRIWGIPEDGWPDGTPRP